MNAGQAAILAGYSPKSARTIGPRLLQKDVIHAYLEDAFSDQVMSPNEVLLRLSDIARGDIGEVIDEKGNLDYDKARELSKTRLIRDVTQKTTIISSVGEGPDTEIHETNVKMYDALRALGLLAKASALFDKRDTLKIETWQDRAILDIKAGDIEYEALAHGFGYDIAAALFTAAGKASEIQYNQDAITIDAPALTDSARQTGGDNSEPSDA